MTAVNRTYPFLCPPSFDLEAFLTLSTSSFYREKYGASLPPSILPNTLSEKEGEVYLSCVGKVWKQVPFPFDVPFFPVERKETAEFSYRHDHTEFALDELRFHLDHVFFWKYGPLRVQRTLSLFERGELKAVSVGGGMSGGAVWGTNKLTHVSSDFLLQTTVGFNQNDTGLHLKREDDRFPFYLFRPVASTPFALYDFSKKSLNRQGVFNRIDINDLEPFLHSRATHNDRILFLQRILPEIDSELLSREAIETKVSVQLFVYGEYVLKDSNVYIFIASKDRSRETEFIRFIAGKIIEDYMA